MKPNRKRYQDVVDITPLVQSGPLKVHESGRWRYFYEEALEKAGAEYGLSSWSLPGYEETYDDPQEACEAFSLPVRRVECTRFFIVDADFAQDLFGYGETIVTAGKCFEGLCIWCRPPEDLDGNVLEELEVDLCDPFE